MKKIYLTGYDGTTRELDRLNRDAWIDLVAPTTEEIESIAKDLNIDEKDIRAAMDLEEKSRIENQHKSDEYTTWKYTLILAEIPIKILKHNKEVYKIIPLVIICYTGRETVHLENNFILSPPVIITICSEDNSVLQYFRPPYSKGFSTGEQTDFVYQIMLRISLLFQQDLIDINKQRVSFEEHIRDTKDEISLINLHELKSTLVHFVTSLRNNNYILEKLNHKYPGNEELFEDVIIESQQAMGMADIYGDILDSTRELMSSIMDVRLNNTMKRLTTITLVMSILSMVFGMYGMNVDPRGMPFAHAIYGFSIVICLAIFICIVVLIILKKNRLM